MLSLSYENNIARNVFFLGLEKGSGLGHTLCFLNEGYFNIIFLLGVIYKFTITRNVFFLEPERQSGSGHTKCFLNEWAAAVSAQDAGRGLRIPQ